MGFSRQESWNGLSCPSPGDLSDPGTESASLMPPALAGGFFTTSAIWEAPYSTYINVKIKAQCHMGFPGGSDGKEFACNAEDLSSIPGAGRFLGAGRSSGEGNGNPLQYSCLENLMDRAGYGPWGHKSQTQLK